MLVCVLPPAACWRRGHHARQDGPLHSHHFTSTSFAHTQGACARALASWRARGAPPHVTGSFQSHSQFGALCQRQTPLECHIHGGPLQGVRRGRRWMRCSAASAAGPISAAGHSKPRQVAAGRASPRAAASAPGLRTVQQRRRPAGPGRGCTPGAVGPPGGLPAGCGQITRARGRSARA